MAQLGFDKLLRSIHNAVLKAQELTEEQHIRQLDKYFDDRGKPIVQELEVPSLHPDKKPGETEVLQVPLLSLIPPSAIKIKEMKVSFRTRLGNSTGKDDKEDTLQIDINAVGRDAAESMNMATVEITFAGSEPPESFLRINDHLVKSII